MISVKEAQDIILNNVSKLKNTELVRIDEALGRIIANDVVSKENIPPFNNSAMDGFAIKAKDSFGASKKSPRMLEVIEDLPAGYVAAEDIRRGEAIRIMTGAPVPKGADSVIMVEDTEKIKNQKLKIKNLKEKKEFVKMFKEIKTGENIRNAGEDIKKREVVIKKGAVLDSAHIGILASLGITKIKVIRKPKIAILATGDELVGISCKLAPGKIRSSNTYTLSSEVLKCNAEPVNLGIAKDNPAQLNKKLREGLKYDMILSSGGVSVGDYDLVKVALKKMGTNIKFWKVAMKPGKPLAFGTKKNKLIFGLPGNPVSSMVSFEIFVKPAISKLLGKPDNDGREVEAKIEEDIIKKKGIRYFLRAKTYRKNGNYFTKTTGPQGSGILKSMALANSLIILPEDLVKVEKFDKVKVRFLN